MKIANESFNDESFSKIMSSIYAKLNDMQKQEAKRQFVQLDPIYKITNIKKAIYPRPLDDEDCAPEFVPIKMGQPRPELRKGQQSLFQPSLEGEPDYGRQYAFTFQLHEAVISKEKKKKLANEIKGLEIAALDGDATAQYVYASRLNTFRSFKDYLSKVDLQYKTANKWLAKSAKGGLANAQYELGRNMLLGRGCEVDMINGYKQINAAAYSGYSPAQTTLAQLSLTGNDLSIEKSKAIISRLKHAAQSDDFEAKVLLAWELSVSTSPDLQNGTKALELLMEQPDTYFDDLRILETTAPAHAANGDFKAAGKLQLKSKKLADKRDWVIPLIVRRLETYQSGESFSGSYH